MRFRRSPFGQPWWADPRARHEAGGTGAVGMVNRPTGGAMSAARPAAAGGFGRRTSNLSQFGAPPVLNMESGGSGDPAGGAAGDAGGGFGGERGEGGPGSPEGAGSQGGNRDNPYGNYVPGIGQGGPAAPGAPPGEGGGEGGGEEGGGGFDLGEAPQGNWPDLPQNPGQPYGNQLEWLIRAQADMASQRRGYVIPFEQELFRQLMSILTTGGFEGTVPQGQAGAPGSQGQLTMGPSLAVPGASPYVGGAVPGPTQPTTTLGTTRGQGGSDSGFATNATSGGQGSYPDMGSIGGNVDPATGLPRAVGGAPAGAPTNPLATGGSGAFIPIIQQALERSKQGTGMTLAETSNQLSGVGLGGTKFGQQILAGIRQGGRQEASNIPTDIALKAINLGASLLPSATSTIQQGYSSAGSQAAAGYQTGSNYAANIYEIQTRQAIADLNAQLEHASQGVSMFLGQLQADTQMDLGELDASTRIDVANIAADAQRQSQDRAESNARNRAIGGAVGSIAGAAIGSIVPGVGTAIGGIAGGAVGGGVGSAS